MPRTFTEPLRSRHEDLRERIERIGSAARLVPELDPAARVAAVRPVVEFLRGELRLHAEAEERWLYPEIAHRLRHPLATAAMTFDHRLLREYYAALEADDGRDADALQATLYGVQALLDAHFRKEEELYLPQLENKEDEETAGAIYEAMRRHEAGEPPLRAVEQLDLEREEFPFSGSELARLAYLLRYATRAPSSHNSQPWRVRPEPDALLLYADRTRALPVVDPDDRELEISCGAFLHHLRLGIRQHGYEDRVSLLPDTDDPDLLARVQLGPELEPEYEERLLFWAIAKRRTNRRPFEAKLLPDELVQALVDAAAAEGTWLQVLGDGARTELGRLVNEADRAQLHDPRFRRELASWLHAGRGDTKDGLPDDVLGHPHVPGRLRRFAVRTFDLGKGVAAHEEALVEASPVLAVLGTEGDTTADRLAAGQALSRVLLRATQDGLSASFLNQPVEVPETRPAVAELTGRSGVPQLVLRFGYGPEAKPTPRRPVAEILAPPG